MLRSTIIKRIKTFADHNDWVYRFSLVPFPDGKDRIITCSKDKTLRIFTESGCEKTIEHTTFLFSILYIPNKNLVVTTDWNGDLIIWRISKDTLVRDKNVKVAEPKNAVWQLTEVSDNDILCCVESGISAEGFLFRYNFSDDKVYQIYPKANSKATNLSEKRFIVQSKISKEIVFFGGGKMSNQIDMESSETEFRILKYDWRKEKVEVNFDGHTDRINCLTTYFINQEELIISGSEDELIIIWHSDGKIKRKIEVNEKMSCFLELENGWLFGSYISYSEIKPLTVNIHFLSNEKYKDSCYEVEFLGTCRDNQLRYMGWARPNEKEKTDFYGVGDDGVVTLHQILHDRYVFPIQKFSYEDELGFHSKCLADFEIIRKDGNIYLLSSGHDNRLVLIDLKNNKSPIGVFNSPFLVLCMKYLKTEDKLVIFDGEGDLSICELVIDDANSDLKFISCIRCRKPGEEYAIQACFEIDPRNEMHFCVAYNIMENERNQPHQQSSIALIQAIEKEGDTIEKKIDYDYEAVEAFFEEQLMCAMFSKKYENVVYVGGGDEDGKDFTLKKFLKKEKKVVELIPENDKMIVVITSVLRNDQETIICSNFNHTIFILEDEKVVNILYTYGGNNPFCAIPITRDCIICGGGFTPEIGERIGGISILDLKEMKTRKLNVKGIIENEIPRKMVFLKDENQLFVGADQRIMIFDICSKENWNMSLDFIERMKFLKENYIYGGKSFFVVIEDVSKFRKKRKLDCTKFLLL